jgi:hypothetical protein
MTMHMYPHTHTYAYICTAYCAYLLGGEIYHLEGGSKSGKETNIFSFLTTCKYFLFKNNDVK